MQKVSLNSSLNSSNYPVTHQPCVSAFAWFVAHVHALKTSHQDVRLHQRTRLFLFVTIYHRIVYLVVHLANPPWGIMARYEGTAAANDGIIGGLGWTDVEPT